MICNPLIAADGGSGIKMATGTAGNSSGTINIKVGFKPLCIILSRLSLQPSDYSLGIDTFSFVKPENTDELVCSETGIQYWTGSSYVYNVTITYKVLFTEDGLTITKASSSSDVSPYTPFDYYTFYWFALG